MTTQVTNEELMAMIRKLQAENEALRNSQGGKLTLKVSEKGGVSLYGMGRWPVTLYRSQWERLFKAKEQIEAFIQANRAMLKEKGED